MPKSVPILATVQTSHWVAGDGPTASLERRLRLAIPVGSFDPDATDEAREALADSMEQLGQGSPAFARLMTQAASHGVKPDISSEYFGLATDARKFDTPAIEFCFASIQGRSTSAREAFGMDMALEAAHALRSAMHGFEGFVDVGAEGSLGWLPMSASLFSRHEFLAHTASIWEARRIRGGLAAAIPIRAAGLGRPRTL